MTRRELTLRRVRNIARWGLITGLVMQIGAAGAVVAIDEARKRRNPPTNEFPVASPHSVRVGKNDTTIYTFGADLYKDMLEAIDSATTTVYFETYILKADEVGAEFRNALIRAARRGVEVYIILDTFGNLNQDLRYRRFPEIETLHVIRFPLLRHGWITGSARSRGFDHRKILVVDGTVGFVGGFNVGKLYARSWRDTHMRVIGPQAWELADAFVEMWNVFRKRHHPILPDESTAHWDSEIRAVQNIPIYKSYPVRALYLDALERSSKRAWITMAYFIPDAGLMRSLENAARRGVDVRILVPQYSNHILADWVGRPHYSRLLRAGVRIFLYEDAMVHSKTMTADGTWSTVGTTNIDELSMNGNYEVNLHIYSDEFAAKMEEIFEMDLTNAHELLPEVWEQRPASARLAERLLAPLAPFF